MNGPRRICAKRISRLISEFALSSERRDSRQPATTLIGAGWCFHYTKSFKATWHSVARGDVVLQLQQRTQGNRPQRRSGRGGASTTPRQASRQPGITSLEAGSCFNYYTASFCSGTRGTKLIKQYVQEAQARVVMG
ncbi:hypothetical protein PR003_g28096 [Phytophthora rubi]|uniref:Uncharacterized protein n=1 Tax=Phytophthora rubi TaxID=129364 RepID=A0A6A4C2L3_9STRA|nr:hypothetical protein PR003_g28096 [Phytophthora rubi]